MCITCVLLVNSLDCFIAQVFPIVPPSSSLLCLLSSWNSVYSVFLFFINCRLWILPSFWISFLSSSVPLPCTDYLCFGLCLFFDYDPLSADLLNFVNVVVFLLPLWVCAWFFCPVSWQNERVLPMFSWMVFLNEAACGAILLSGSTSATVFLSASAYAAILSEIACTVALQGGTASVATLLSSTACADIVAVGCGLFNWRELSSPTLWSHLQFGRRTNPCIFHQSFPLLILMDKLLKNTSYIKKIKYRLTELAQETHKIADSDAETLYHRGCSFNCFYQSFISEKLYP